MVRSIHSSQPGRLYLALPAIRLSPISCYQSLATSHLSLVIPLPSVWKTVSLNLVQSPYLFICHLFCIVSVRLEDGISITGYDEMALAISSCPGTGMCNVRLENATSQPCSSDEPMRGQHK